MNSRFVSDDPVREDGSSNGCGELKWLRLFEQEGFMPLSVSLVLASLFLCTVAPQASPVEAAGPGQSQVAPQQNPDASGKYHVGDGVSPPKLLYAPDPEYTDQARRKRLQGKIVLSLTVDTKGKPQDVRVLHSLAETVDKKLQAAAVSLDEKAVTAVKQYRFDPALFQGKPVSVETTVEVNYRIY
jgi:TonB family protein